MTHTLEMRSLAPAELNLNLNLTGWCFQHVSTRPRNIGELGPEDPNSDGQGWRCKESLNPHPDLCPFMPFSSWVSWRTGFGDGTRNHIISWEIFGRWGVRKHWMVCVQCHEVAQHAQPRLGDCATNATSPHQVACVRTHIEATKKTYNRKHPLGSSCAHHISLWKAWCALENITHTTPTGCRSHTAIWGHQVTRNFGKGPFSAMNFLMTSFGGVVVPSS